MPSMSHRVAFRLVHLIADKSTTRFATRTARGWADIPVLAITRNRLVIPLWWVPDRPVKLCPTTPDT